MRVVLFYKRIRRLASTIHDEESPSDAQYFFSLNVMIDCIL